MTEKQAAVVAAIKARKSERKPASKSKLKLGAERKAAAEEHKAERKAESAKAVKPVKPNAASGKRSEGQAQVNFRASAVVVEAFREHCAKAGIDPWQVFRDLMSGTTGVYPLAAGGGE